MAAGLAGWPLAKSAVWELGLISATGGLFGLLALPLLFRAAGDGKRGSVCGFDRIAVILLLRFHRSAGCAGVWLVRRVSGYLGAAVSWAG